MVASIHWNCRANVIQGYYTEWRLLQKQQECTKQGTVQFFSDQFIWEMWCSAESDVKSHVMDGVYENCTYINSISWIWNNGRALKHRTQPLWGFHFGKTPHMSWHRSSEFSELYAMSIWFWKPNCILWKHTGLFISVDSLTGEIQTW